MKEVWQILRSDRHKRCNSCLKILKRGQKVYRLKNWSILRFPNVCGVCFLKK